MHVVGDLQSHSIHLEPRFAGAIGLNLALKSKADRSHRQLNLPPRGLERRLVFLLELAAQGANPSEMLFW